MNLDSYSIQQLENIDFRSNFGKKLKSETGLSSKEIKKHILDLIEKKREDDKRESSKDYQDMIKLLPDKFINIRQSQFHNSHLKSEKDEEIDNIDFTMDENNVNEDIDNIDFTCEESKPTIKTVETETNSVNYIVQLFNQDETVQLKLTRDQFINFATNNGYSQEFILDFLNQGNQNNVCKIDEFQWLNDDFLSKLKIVLEDLPLFFDSELCLTNDKLENLHNEMYQNVLDCIEENKRRNIEELKEMNNEQLETLKNQYSTINTIEERLNNRFSEYQDRDMLKECDLIRESRFFQMINELDMIEDLRMRGFITHYKFDCIHNKQREVIDKIVRILIPPPKGFKN
jgi:hypothetical protein